MKKLLTAIVLFVGLTSAGMAQGNPPLTAFQLDVFDPLPSISFANLVVSNGLSATQPIFRVIMSPGTMVKISGEMYWTDINSTTPVKLADFRTREFSSRTILSNQFGSGDIRIEDDYINQDAIDQNLNKGRPIGTYSLTLWVLDPVTNAPLSLPGITNPQQRSLTFYNPSQTITITAPMQGSVEQPTDVIVSWTQVTGAASYIIKVNNRKVAGQTDEEILNSENPIVNNRDVGNRTTVNLRSIMQREWAAGDEIVVRVSAFVPGPSGGFNLESNLVRFSLAPANNLQVQQQNSALTQIISFLPPNIVAQFNNLLQGQNISISGFRNADGTIMTQAEVTAILQYLQANPQNVLNMQINTNSGNN